MNCKKKLGQITRILKSAPQETALRGGIFKGLAPFRLVLTRPFVCLSVCFSIRLSLCMAVCLYVCVTVYSFVSRFVSLFACLDQSCPVSLLVCLDQFCPVLSVCLSVCRLSLFPQPLYPWRRNAALILLKSYEETIEERRAETTMRPTALNHISLFLIL